MHDPDTRHQWVSVKQAAIHFGTSESDIRRRIRRGELESESLARPGGTLLRVRLPTPEDTPDTRQSEIPTPETSHPAPEPSPAAPDTLQHALSAALGPLSEALASERAERQKLAQENADLRERVGRAEEGERNASDALEAVTLERNALADEVAWLKQPWWRRLRGRPPA
jgi:hypothetical protein